MGRSEFLSTSIGIGSELLALLDMAEPLPLGFRIKYGSTSVIAAFASSATRHDAEGRKVEDFLTPNERIVTRALSTEERETMAPEGWLPRSTTCDVALSDRFVWRNVPEPIWTFSLGKGPVLPSWLEARTLAKILRPLTLTEIQEFADIARRIAILIQQGRRLRVLRRMFEERL